MKTKSPSPKSKIVASAQGERKPISAKDWKILIAESGGYCAFPDCPEYLVADATDDDDDDDDQVFLGDVPSPIRITDHVGDTPKNKLLSEVLSMTKMNWNSANMYSKVPITLMFSHLVGDIMREIPDTMEPQRKYKFYI